MTLIQTSGDRYDRIAATLHWLIAMALIAQLCSGWYMNEAMVDHSPPQAWLEGVHISFGLSILLLVLVRIAWRLMHRAPPLPNGMPSWERQLAHTSHLVFYLLMLALPLTGWALVSMGAKPISFWGLPWPHLPGISQMLGAQPSRALRHQIAHIHVFILIWVFVVNLALHIAGAVKHQFDGRPVLWRITGLQPTSRSGL